MLFHVFFVWAVTTMDSLRGSCPLHIHPHAALACFASPACVGLLRRHWPTIKLLEIVVSRSDLEHLKQRGQPSFHRLQQLLAVAHFAEHVSDESSRSFLMHLLRGTSM